MASDQAGARPPSKTVQSDHAARESAKERWLEMSVVELEAVARACDTRPSDAPEHIRKYLEACAATVRVCLDPQFKPYDGKDLRTTPLGEALQHLPRERVDLARIGKGISDLFAHNQGHPQETSARVVRGILAMLLDLAEWQWQLVNEPLPESIRAIAESIDPVALERRALAREASAQARGEKQGARRVWRWTVPLGLGACALAGVTARSLPRSLPRSGEATAALAEPEQRAEQATQRAGGPGGAVVSGVSDVRLDRLAAELTAGDVPRILSLYRFPLRWYFGKANAHEAEVRRLIEEWYRRRSGEHHLHLFEQCRGMPAAPGEQAFQCMLRLSPPLPTAPAAPPTPCCVVFDASGLVISRTELDKVPGCPPSP
jgi:hypothetical protein